MWLPRSNASFYAQCCLFVAASYALAACAFVVPLVPRGLTGGAICPLSLICRIMAGCLYGGQSEKGEGDEVLVNGLNGATVAIKMDWDASSAQNAVWYRRRLRSFWALLHTAHPVGIQFGLHSSERMQLALGGGMPEDPLIRLGAVQHGMPGSELTHTKPVDKSARALCR